MKIEKVHEAKIYALEKHGEQKYGNHPYEYHLVGVKDFLSIVDPYFNYGLDVEIQNEAYCLSWLHDVVEDTDATLYDIEKRFGKKMSTFVEILTKNQNDTYLDYILKIDNSKEYVPILVKLADLKFNKTECKVTKKKSMFDKYELAEYILNGKIKLKL